MSGSEPATLERVGDGIANAETGEIVEWGGSVGDFDPSKWDDNVNLFTQTLQELEERQFILGAIAHNVMARWGTRGRRRQVLEAFAKDVGYAVSTIYEYARVFEAFPEADERPAELSYSHMREATLHDDPMEAAIEAAASGMSTRAMMRERKTREQSSQPSETTGQPARAEERKRCPHCKGEGWI